jgi:hypothetical protein
MRHDTREGWSIGLVLAIGASMAYVLLGYSGGSEVALSSDLAQIKKFVAIEVQVQGTAEKLGLKRGDLTDLTRLTFLKNSGCLA